MGNEEFYISKIKYRVSCDDKKCKRINNLDCYGKVFTIYKNDEYWSVVELRITGQAITVWKQKDKDFDINKFLSRIVLPFIKISIYNNEINKIGDDLKIKEFTFVSCEPSNSTQVKIMDTPNRTLEYYEKQAIEIDKPRIGFK